MSDQQTPSVGPAAVKKIVIALIVLCVVFSVADFAYHKHGHFDFENIPGFHTLYGFACCVVLGVIAGQMRRFVQRDEDYYDPAETEEAQDA
jgi:hypothetical protein